MKITKRWLQEKGACRKAIEDFEAQKEQDAIKILNLLLEQNELDWANWLIVRVMTRKQYLSYAIFAAEQVIDIYEKKYPDDNRPRNAIEAAKKVLKFDSRKNRNDTSTTAAAAYDAANAAYAAYVATDVAAVYAAYTAAAAAAYAAYTAYTTAAADAATAAYIAADAARRTLKTKILKYGIKLLQEAQ